VLTSRSGPEAECSHLGAARRLLRTKALTAPSALADHAAAVIVHTISAAGRARQHRFIMFLENGGVEKCVAAHPIVDDHRVRGYLFLYIIVRPSWRVMRVWLALYISRDDSGTVIPSICDVRGGPIPRPVP